MRKSLLLFLLVVFSLFTSCSSENYSNGERIGLITQFSKTGILWKSWEGHLNMTQTGMNSSAAFDFSVDNDQEPPGLVATLDSAAQYGWKVKLIYHQVFMKNWFQNRGHTDYFIKECEILDRNPVQNVLGGTHSESPPVSGKIIDTIYVVIDRTK